MLWHKTNREKEGEKSVGICDVANRGSEFHDETIYFYVFQNILFAISVSCIYFACSCVDCLLSFRLKEVKFSDEWRLFVKLAKKYSTKRGKARRHLPEIAQARLIYIYISFKQPESNNKKTIHGWKAKCKQLVLLRVYFHYVRFVVIFAYEFVELT